MSFWTYILRCSDGRYYTGHSDDLEGGIAEHGSGLNGYTSSRLPVRLAWSQAFPSREEALSAERQIKGWSRAKKEALIGGDWDGVQALTQELFVAVRSRSTPKPIIILVRPQLGENIGKAARAMLNFGLTEMRLVAPRDGWPNPSAGPAASGADVVLERAEVFDTVQQAIADCTYVYASTVRRRDLVVPVIAPETMAENIRAGSGRSAILFGPERSGLETEDVSLANAIVTVPINPEFGSLNLAQAVILLAYEWSRDSGLAVPPAKEAEAPALASELDGLLEQLDNALDKKGYFFPPDRVQSTKNNIRTIFTKPGWSSREVSAVRGILRSLYSPTRTR